MKNSLLALWISKIQIYIFCTIFSLMFFCVTAYSQITQADGLRMPGDWNSWTNNHGMGGAFDLQKITTGTTRWKTTFQYTGLTGTQTFKFVSGGSGSPWYNQWAGNSGIVIDGFSNLTYGNTGGTPPGNNSVTVTNNMYYTVNWQDIGYVNNSVVFMETSAAPVTFTNLSFSPDPPLPWETVDVEVTASASPCAEENVFLRYTTDGFVNSSLIEVSFTGVDGVASIPALPAGTNVVFYAFSTTKDLADIDPDFDMFTINLINNSGSNYSYTVQTPDSYETASDGDWSIVSTWLGGLTPPDYSKITIKHAVFLDTDYIASELVIAPTGELSFESGRTLTIESNGAMINNGTFIPDDSYIIVNSNVSLSGAFLTRYYDVLVQGDNINFDTGTSQITSSLEISSGYVNTAPEFFDGSSLIYSKPGDYLRSTEWNNPYSVMVYPGTNLKLRIDEFGGDLTILSDLVIINGATVDMEATTHKLIVNGGVYIDGELKLSTAIGGDLEVYDYWERTDPGTFTPNGRMVTFASTSVDQGFLGHTTFDYLKIDNSGFEVIMNDGMTINQAMYVEADATLNMGNQLIDGAGSFQLIGNGKLKIGDLAGISSSGATGNIQTTGTRTFSTTGKYHYIGNGNQVSGNALPIASAAKQIIVELTDDAYEFSINTSSSVAIASGGQLKIISGKFIEATIAANGRHVDGAGDLIMSGGEYHFLRVAAAQDVPRLTGVYSLTGGSVVLGASGNQKLKSGKAYNNLIFRSSDTVFVASAIPSIVSVDIQDTKIVSTGSSTFGNATTLLTMSGGKLIVAGARTLPDMDGTYNLTGGTIEFAGASANHTIRGSKEYYNIDVTGTSVGTSSDFSIKLNGKFTIKNNAVFSFFSTDVMTGLGSFVLEAGGTLLYGSANGIAASAASGNILVTGGRTFPSNATYGFIGAANQIAGDGLPSTVANLIINKSSNSKTVTLGQNHTVTNSITLNLGKIITGANTLTLDNSNPSSLIAGTANANFANSWISGNMKRRVANVAGFYFPVGTAANLQIGKLDFTALTDGGNPYVNCNFTNDATGIDISALELKVDGTLLTDRLDNGYWTLTSEDISAFTADIILIASGFSNGSSNSNAFALIKRNGGDWIIPNGTHSNSTQSIGAGVVVVQRSGISSFSDYAVAYNNKDVTLPVELLDFNAEKLSDKQILISWKTASELNNDYFVLERSFDANNFTKIAQIQGSGNSNQIIEYSYIDNLNTSKKVYYRLMQVDIDSKISYSETISVDFTQDLASNCSVFYSNDNLVFNLTNFGDSKISYRLYNSIGQVTETGSCGNFDGGVYCVPVNLKPGVYIINVNSENLYFNSKVVVK